MKQKLEGLKTEIEQYLEQSGMAVFYGCSRAQESLPVYWDCDQHPDYRQFVQAARAAGVKLIVFHQREFSSGQIDEAVEQLEGCDLPAEDYREFERHLNRMRAYDGLICAIELSFDLEGRVFLFDLHTDWYQELADLMDEIQVLTATPDDDETPLGGYFSKN
ncbi:MAG: hypothetical protein LAP38_19295 [Acidobacteriia bacterium]|nr:hypothetical protein [Terriglobia bacterium]